MHLAGVITEHELNVPARDIIVGLHVPIDTGLGREHRRETAQVGLQSQRLPKRYDLPLGRADATCPITTVLGTDILIHAIGDNEALWSEHGEQQITFILGSVLALVDEHEVPGKDLRMIDGRLLCRDFGRGDAAQQFIELPLFLSVVVCWILPVWLSIWA